MNLAKFFRVTMVLLCGLGALPLLAAAGSDAGITKRFGIFVGANDGGPSRERLQWAVSDANRIASVMQELGGLETTNTIQLSNPSLDDIQKAFPKVKALIDRNRDSARRIEFMFYYSGHSDDTGLLVGSDLFRYDALRQKINSMGADVSIAILDSCASGAFTRTKGGTRVQPFLLDDSQDMKGYAFLTSASETESAQESDSLGASFFTHFMVTALRGAADLNGDGRVTLNEAYQYAFTATLARTESTVNGPQHPNIDIQLKGSGDLVLSDLTQPSSSLLLSDDLEGRVSVRDEKTVLVAQLTKSSGSPLVLALPAGAYAIRIENDKGVFTSAARLVKGSKAIISAADLSKANLSQTRTRGDGKTPADGISINISGLDLNDLKDLIGQAVANQLQGIGLWNLAEAVAPPASSEVVDTKPLTDQVLEEARLRYTLLPDQPAPVQTTQTVAPTNSSGRTEVGFHFQVVPGVGTPMGAFDLSTEVTLAPLVAAVGENHGFMASTLLNIIASDTDGVQFAGIGNIYGGTSSGWQGAGVFNIASNDVDGFQSSGLFNIVRGNINYGQIAGLFNIAKHADVLQFAGLFNAASVGVSGVQLAGVFNQAKRLEGVAVAGGINVTEQLAGVQIAPVNIVSKDATGVQIGIFNYADQLVGLPIGVVSISRIGIHDLRWWMNDAGRMWLGFANGSKNFYSALYLGVNTQDILDFNGFALGFSMGTRFELGPFYFDLELGIRRPSTGSTLDARMASLFDGSDFAAGLPRLVPNTIIDVGLNISGFRIFAGLSTVWQADGVNNASDMLTAGSNGNFTIGSQPFSISNSLMFGVALSF